MQIGAMKFIDSEFNGTIPLLQGATFERCIFNVDDLDVLPAVWRCMDCIVVHDGQESRFGRSEN